MASRGRSPGRAPVHPSPDQFAEVLGLIEVSTHRAFTAINKELIDLYWDIGPTISRRIAADGWGQGTVLAHRRSHPETPTRHERFLGPQPLADDRVEPAANRRVSTRAVRRVSPAGL